MNDALAIDFTGMEDFGVSGSRHGTQGCTLQHLALRYLIESFHDAGVHVMHHGKATGVDSEAHMIAYRLRTSGMKVVMHPPDNAAWRNDALPVDGSWVVELPAKGYHARDRDIARSTSALLIAPEFPEDDPRSAHSRTWVTARYARSYGRLVLWCDRHGNIHDVTEAQHAST